MFSQPHCTWGSNC
uniref:Uncharacterized protein n=1 Tax=Anguilla anguilla TaxID=7936 RepID=A0A0E9TEW7_ANGAN